VRRDHTQLQRLKPILRPVVTPGLKPGPTKQESAETNERQIAEVRTQRHSPLFSVFSVLMLLGLYSVKEFGGLGSTLTNPISRGRRPRSATPNPL